MPKSKSRCCRSCEKRILFHDLYQVLFEMDFFSSFHLFQKKNKSIFIDFSQWRKNHLANVNYGKYLSRNFILEILMFIIPMSS